MLDNMLNADVKYLYYEALALTMYLIFSKFKLEVKTKWKTNTAPTPRVNVNCGYIDKSTLV